MLKFNASRALRPSPLTLALAATLCTGLPALAQQAQKEELRQITTPAGGLAATPSSSVSIYGLIDTSIGYVSSPNGRITRVDSGHMNGSRLGFKGSEDLGGGLRANFLLEMGINSDSGTLGQNQGAGAKGFGRGALVSLTGNFGEIRLGRTVTAISSEVQAVGDAFGLGGAGNLQGIQPASGRVNNSIWYQTPSMAGFIGKVSYAPGETSPAPGSGLGSSTGSSSAAALFYANKALSGALSYTVHKHIVDGSSVKWFNSSLAYDFGAAKVFGSFAMFKNPSAAITPATQAAADNNLGFAGFPTVGYYAGQDDRSASLGVAVPFGRSTVLAQVVHVNDRGPLNRDATQVGVAYLYALSKRTSLYADYGRVKNRNGSAYALTGATSQAQPGRNGNSDALYLGVRHAF